MASVREVVLAVPYGVGKLASIFRPARLHTSDKARGWTGSNCDACVRSRLVAAGAPFKRQMPTGKLLLIAGYEVWHI
jgi:hypothetical protein